MNTNALKSFAKEARSRLLALVEQKVLYWGFDKTGKTTKTVESVKGGYIFRGETFSDESIPRKWAKLISRIKDEQSFKDVIEEAAYTWFNRLIAIKILQKNGYDNPVLEYMPGTRTPAILQAAKRGQSALSNDKLLKTYLQNDDEERAFALLLVEHIKSHVLLRNVFGHIENFTELLLPDNLLANNGLIEFINTTEAISDKDYKEVELIGWLYQFYISDKKDEVFAGFKKNKKKWFPCNKGGTFRKWFGNNEYVVNWENNGEEMRNFNRSVLRNQNYYFMEGATWSTISSGVASFRYSPVGHLFESKGSICFSKTEKTLLQLLAYLNSKLAIYFLYFFSPTMDYHEGPVGRLPFKLFSNSKIIDTIVKKCITIVKNDWDSNELSWEFKFYPISNSNYSIKKVIVNWLQTVTNNFFLLHSYEEEINYILIDAYDMQDELAPVITILQYVLDPIKLDKLNDELSTGYQKYLRANEKDKNVSILDYCQLPIKKEVVIQQLLSYAVGCLMGRYRLDKPGLNIAHPNPTAEEVKSYTYHSEKFEIDKDAIIPIMGSESPFHDDIVVRTKHFVKAVWGEETLIENINFIEDALTALGSNMNLEKYLTEKFWDFHKKMYKKKPINWCFASNSKSAAKSAFKVLVYMHRMDRFTVQQIRNKYLHPYIAYLRNELEQLEKDEANPEQPGGKQAETIPPGACRVQGL